MRVLVALLILSLPAIAQADSSNLQLVGQSALYGRGMNAALALYDHYVYIGNRTDASTVCVGASGVPNQTGCAHPHPGILIVDAADPSKPSIVGEIGPPYAGEVGITTRELRVWPQKKLLIVMNFRCSRVLHACALGTDKMFPFDLKFFSLADPLHPKFLSSYVPTSHAGLAVKPHEMFLWVDPKNADRALLYISTPALEVDPTLPNLIVADISQVPSGGAVREIAEGNWNDRFPGTNQADYPLDPATKKCGPYDCNLFVHSMGVTADGTRTFLAMEAGQFLVLDTTSIARDTQPNAVQSLNGDLLTGPANRPTWLQRPPSASAVPAHCPNTCPNGHSAIKVPGRSLVLTTDEVYGTYTDPAQGCPWGWERLIDVSDPAHPSIVGEYKIAQDNTSYCAGLGANSTTNLYTSFSSHNPTALPDLAIVAWHAGGLQVSDISDPAHPVQAGFFVPTPLATVATEDPALTRGGSKIAVWSYPIIKDGLIYVVDIRNGLFILRYTGPHADEVSSIKFLEGNSNLGDAVRLDAGR
ncbi:MAG TPA: hypothetical protein VEJ41_07525 [Candidatus Acidoferrales bacterium]|nr:hypothetical protein [Candidatus Acidoferrales bacterium]